MIDFGLVEQKLEQSTIQYTTEIPGAYYRAEGIGMGIVIFAFVPEKETPKCVWLSDNGKRHCVLKNPPRKAWAYDTQDKALLAFHWRRISYLGWLEDRLKKANAQYDLVVTELNKKGLFK